MIGLRHELKIGGEHDGRGIIRVARAEDIMRIFKKQENREVIFSYLKDSLRFEGIAETYFCIGRIGFRSSPFEALLESGNALSPFCVYDIFRLKDVEKLVVQKKGLILYTFQKRGRKVERHSTVHVNPAGAYIDASLILGTSHLRLISYSPIKLS